jgi:hypothetical protein
MKITRIILIIVLFSTSSYASDWDIWGGAAQGIGHGISQGIEDAQRMQEIRMMEEQRQQLEQLQKKQAIVEDTMKKFSEKHKAICAKPEYAALFVKTSCLVRDITFEQIADNTKIAPEQKPIFIKYRTEDDTVTKEQLAYMHTFTGSGYIRWVDYLDSTQSEIDKYNLDFLNGVITWGEYNQRRKEMNARQISERRNIFNPIH